MQTQTKQPLKFKFLKKASELEAKPIRALIYGEPGAGKTTLLATLPRPAVIIDFEGGASVRLRGEEDIYIAEIGSYEELKEALKEIEKVEGIKSIAFDGFSVFLQALLDYLVRKDGKANPTFVHWNRLTTLAKSIILNLRKPDKHLVFTAFEKVHKDRETGKVIKIFPDLPRSIREYLRGLVDIEARLFIENGERKLVFADPIAETKDRTGKLSVEEPDFGKILEKIYGNGSKLRFVPSSATGYPTRGHGKSRNVVIEEPKEKTTSEPITEAQIKYIHKLVRDLGWSDDKYRVWLKDIFRKESSKELTKYEASLAIETLKKELEKQSSQREEIEGFDELGKEDIDDVIL